MLRLLPRLRGDQDARLTGGERDRFGASIEALRSSESHCYRCSSFFAAGTEVGSRGAFYVGRSIPLVRPFGGRVQVPSGRRFQT
jgi:hypothetical protein